MSGGSDHSQISLLRKAVELGGYTVHGNRNPSAIQRLVSERDDGASLEGFFDQNIVEVIVAAVPIEPDAKLVVGEVRRVVGQLPVQSVGREFVPRSLAGFEHNAVVFVRAIVVVDGTANVAVLLVDVITTSGIIELIGMRGMSARADGSSRVHPAEHQVSVADALEGLDEFDFAAREDLFGEDLGIMPVACAAAQLETFVPNEHTRTQSRFVPLRSVKRIPIEGFEK